VDQHPNNPTGALATLDFCGIYCQQYILLCHDHAYSEMAYDGYKPPSVLQVPGALDVAIEFHSLSVLQHDRLAGWFVVGSATRLRD